MKRTIALLTVAVMMLVFTPFAISSETAEETHIYFMKANPEELFEGVTCIFTREGWGEELCKEGHDFAWVKVVIFDYDEATGGFKCTETYEIAPVKENITIPERGFAATCNGGNNWPGLFESATGNEWYYNAVSPSLGIPYSECPNFITPLNTANSYALAAIEVGDVLYLSGIDFADAVIDSNESEEIHYWDDSFASNSYLSFVKPDGYIDPFAEEPTTEETHVYFMKANPEELFEGVTCIFTREGWGEELCKEGYDFAWAKVVMFDYDEATGGFKCTETYEIVPAKENITIPERGFAVTCNGGNNWPGLFESATGNEWYYNAVSPSLGIPYSECPNFITPLNTANSYALDSIEVGDVLYLTGIVLADAIIDSSESEGIHYWDDSFVSNSYLSFVKPDGYIDQFEEEPSSEEPTTEEPTTEEPTTEEPTTEEPTTEEPTTEEPTTEEPTTEEPSAGGESESSTQTPHTGDADLFIFALITLIAAAGAVIIQRTR